MSILLNFPQITDYAVNSSCRWVLSEYFGLGDEFKTMRSVAILAKLWKKILLICIKEIWVRTFLSLRHAVNQKRRKGFIESHKTSV